MLKKYLIIRMSNGRRSTMQAKNERQVKRRLGRDGLDNIIQLVQEQKTIGTLNRKG